MELGDPDGGEGCRILCDYVDSDKEIEISECIMYFSKKSSVDGRWALPKVHGIGLTYKLNKNTKYEFRDYLIRSTAIVTHNEYLKVDLSNLTIQFQLSTKTCEMPEHKTDNTTSIVFQMESDDEIYPCKPDDTEQTTESLTSVAASSTRTTFTTQSPSTETNIFSTKDAATHTTEYETSVSSNSTETISYHRSSIVMQGHFLWITIALSLAGTMSFLIYIIQKRRKKRNPMNLW